MASTEQQRAWNNSGHPHRPSGWQRSKLTQQQIDEIRQALADGDSTQELALRYGVSASTIRRYHQP